MVEQEYINCKNLFDMEATTATHKAELLYSTSFLHDGHTYIPRCINTRNLNDNKNIRDLSKDYGGQSFCLVLLIRGISLYWRK